MGDSRRSCALVSSMSPWTVRGNHACISATNTSFGVNGKTPPSEASTPSSLASRLVIRENHIPPPPPPRCQTRGSKRSERSLDSLKAGLHVAQETQTDTSLSLFSQFLYCLLANEGYRKERERAALLTGRSFNSVSRIDSCARY